MRLKFRITIILLICTFSAALAQQDQQVKDTSSHSDSLRVTEMQLLQQQQQQMIDSMLKKNLEKELEAVAGDAQKTKELEEKLRQIAVNDSLRKADQLHKIEQLKKSASGYAVAPFGDTLFFVYTRIGSFSAKERAQAISNRVRELYKDQFFNKDSLKLVENETSYDVIYTGNKVIMSLTNLDALWFNTSDEILATKYLNIIKNAVLKEKEDNSIYNWAKKIGLVLLIILGVSILIYLVNRLFLLTALQIRKYREKFSNGITIKKIKILNAHQLEQFALRINGAVRIFVIILALYLSLPLLFIVFPETRGLTYTLINWILDPARNILNSILNFLPNLFTIAVIYLFTHYILKALKYFANEIASGNLNLKSFHPDFVKPTFNIVRFLLYAFMLVIMWPYLPGSNSPAFQGVSVFLGILVSLGSSSAINNIIAGLVITFMRPFKIGDRVKIGDITGDVIEKTMLVIRIRTIKNEDITVPNSTVLSNNTINYTSNAKTIGLIVHTTVTIGYDVPWQKMHEALINAALRTSNVLHDPPPFVLQTSLDDFYVSYQINAYTREASMQATIYSELHRHIQDCCNEVGIEIMSPHYGALRDGNQTTIPEEYLPKDYKAPGFNIKKDDEKK